MTTLIRAQSCNSCKFVQAVETIDPDGKRHDTGGRMCTFNPPVPFIIPGERGPQCISQFPPVSGDMLCGRYVRGILRSEMQ